MIDEDLQATRSVFFRRNHQMKKHGLAALVELGFMDNAEEFKKLNQPAYQDKLIKGLVQGIQAYFGKA